MKKSLTWFATFWLCRKNHTNLEDSTTCYLCGEKYTDQEMIEDELFFEFPAKNEVCPTCDGTGTTYLGLASRDQPAFTREDFGLEGPDFYEDYMGGNYDAQCPECKGRNVVSVVQEKEIPKGHKVFWTSYLDHARSMAQMDAMERAERAMGA